MKTKMLVIFILAIVLIGTASALLPDGWYHNPWDDSASYSGNKWTLTSDPETFNYVYTNVSGDDIEIIARVVTLYNTDLAYDASAIVMLGEDPTDLNPAQVSMSIQGSTYGNQSFSVISPGSEEVNKIEDLPYWIRLKRNGNMFSGYISPDGRNWTLVGQEQFSVSIDAQVVLAVINNKPLPLGTSFTHAVVEFDNVTVKHLSDGTSGPDNDWMVSGDDMYSIPYGNIGIGTMNPSHKLEVQGGPIKATGGLIIETRTDDPPKPVTGQIWLRTDL